MVRSKMLMVWGLLLCGAGFLINLNGCGGSGSSQKSQGPPPTTTTTPIKHVVVIFQENRSPDNLFQADAKLIADKANIQNYGISAAQPGVHIPLTQVPLGCTPGSC